MTALAVHHDVTIGAAQALEQARALARRSIVGTLRQPQVWLPGLLFPMFIATLVPIRRLAARSFALRHLAALEAANEEVGAANAALIDGADAVLALLDGTDVDSGTAAEIGYAAARAVPVVGWRTDLRRAGDNEATVVNLQVEHFIRRSGGRLAGSLEDALDGLEDLRRD